MTFLLKAKPVNGTTATHNDVNAINKDTETVLRKMNNNNHDNDSKIQSL